MGDGALRARIYGAICLMLHLLNTVSYMFYAMSRDAVMNKAFLFLPTNQLLLHAEPAFPVVERFALGLYW